MMIIMKIVKGAAAAAAAAAGDDDSNKTTFWLMTSQGHGQGKSCFTEDMSSIGQGENV